MKIEKKDLKIETMRGKGEGGQHKNVTDSCVRITHIPTGIVVMKDGRNQHHNKRIAMRELRKRLQDRKQQELAKGVQDGTQSPTIQHPIFAQRPQ